MFDLANCLTVSQIFKLRKHIEDPLSSSFKKVAKPIGTSLTITIIHVICVYEFFQLGVRNPVTCYVVHTENELFEEIVTNIIVILVFGIFYYRFILHKRVHSESTIYLVLGPYIKKQYAIITVQIAMVFVEGVYLITENATKGSLIYTRGDRSVI